MGLLDRLRRRPPPRAVDPAWEADREERARWSGRLHRCWSGVLDPEQNDVWVVSSTTAVDPEGGADRDEPGPDLTGVTVRGVGVVHERGAVDDLHLMLGARVEPPLPFRPGPARFGDAGAVVILCSEDSHMLALAPTGHRDDAVARLALARVLRAAIDVELEQHGARIVTDTRA